jgi:RNA polymerase sigma-70 factor (ECF subfamily)
MPDENLAEQLEAHRPMLVRLAYRMLGSIADAEDIVQDAFLRWRDVDRSTISHPRAYLARVVSRLCLDRMKSASARRETYVGTWLPEPVVAPPSEQLADDLSIALLLTLERLSPLERAAFLLHDVFDMDYSEIADTLERSEAACRQLATRAREHVRDERPRFEASEESREKLTDAFQHAMATGDVTTLAQLLADDAVFYSDGGGKKLAALNPIYGREKIVRFIVGVSMKRPALLSVDRVQLNGLPGFVLHTSEGVETIALEISGQQVVAIYAVRNPDKLGHLS